MNSMHVPGDWSPTLAFALAGSLFLIVPPEPGQYELIDRDILGLSLLFLSAVMSIAAYRGRKIPLSAKVYFWKNLETTFSTVMFSALLFYFGLSCLLLGIVEASWPLLFMGTGFLVFAYYFSLHVRITVVNRDGSIWSMLGKPWSLVRRFSPGYFDELTLSQDFSYAGQLGMIQHWRKHFFVFATKGEKKVLLFRDTTLEDAKASMAELSKITGTPISVHRNSAKSLTPGKQVLPPEKPDLLRRYMTTEIGALGKLRISYPTGQLIKKAPSGFPIGKKKINFEVKHFRTLLHEAKIPLKLVRTTPIQEEIWHFKYPLIIPLKFLKSFEEFSSLGKEQNAAIVFTGLTMQFDDYSWKPDEEYPNAGI